MSSLAVGRGPGDLEQPAAMSSLPVGRRGLEDMELWLAGLFTAAELAAADLLLQLSFPGGKVGDKVATTSSTPSSSPRSCCECACAEEDKEAERVVLEEDTALPLASSTELDRRARKRHRLLADIYAATTPVTAAAATTAAAKKENKRKRRHPGAEGDGSSSSSESSVEEATRYGRGGDY